MGIIFINSIKTMKSAVIALFLGAASAIKVQDAPPYFNEPTWNERMSSAGGFLQISACVNSGVQGVTCSPPNHEYFATGMNGDEDLAEDIIMKGEPYHYNQKKQNLVQWNPVVVESTGPLPACHGNNGPDGKNCAKETCSGTNGPKDGHTGTPCTREEPADIPHYNTDPEAGRPYQTTGDLTHTSPAGWAGDDHHMPDYAAVQGDDLSAPEKVHTLDPKIARTHTTFYNKQ